MRPLKGVYKMTPEQLAEIRERVNKATRKHNWFVRGATSINVNWYGNNDVYIAETFIPKWHENRQKGEEEAYANAKFIAHAREDVPALLDEIERLRKALKKISLGEYVCHGGYCTASEEARQALEGNHES